MDVTHTGQRPSARWTHQRARRAGVPGGRGSLASGTRLGAYEIVAPIGSGGMGEVYRARDTKLDRDVAVKVLPERLAQDEAALARFDREAKSIAALSHPNILAIFDSGTDRGSAFVVTELLEGETLRERLNRGPIGTRRALDYSLHVARGLAAAHERGIVHRDIKPENVFVTSDGQVKTLDFGLAKPSESPVSADASATRFETGAGMVVGTAGYMAPEQVRGQTVDHRADIFAFGVLLYEMLTGSRAFAGTTPADTMSAVLSADPPAIDMLALSVPPALDRIVRRCIEKQPALRFQSARDLAFAIETLTSLSSSSGAGLPAVSAPPRRRPYLVAAGALAALAAGVVIGASFMKNTALQGPSVPPVARFSYDAGFVFPPLLLLSPDGRTIAYNSPTHSAGSLGALWLRPLDGSASSAGFPTTTPDVPLAWSPDSRRLLVYSQGKLVRIDTATGAREALMAVPGIPRGVAWLADDGLLLGAERTIARVPAGGGVPADMMSPRALPTDDGWSTTPRRAGARRRSMPCPSRPPGSGTRCRPRAARSHLAP